jgi:beta-barrel assembly-enhancing protease
MKRLFLFLIILLPFSVFGQINLELQGEVTRRISSELPAGANVELISILPGGVGFSGVAILMKDDTKQGVPVKNLERINFTASNIKQFWQIKALQEGVYDNIASKGLQLPLRREMEQEAIEYLTYLENNNLIFNDSYLESYLYSLAYRLYPEPLDDGRPGVINIKIVKDINANAWIYPNGTMLISTGLLSTIHSGEELTAALAHEIAHFVLDHSVLNVTAQRQRQQRAEFWAAFATTMAAAADIYMATKNEHYLPGNLTMNTAILAYSVAATVNQRLGLSFSREQELKADQIAAELMSFINNDPTALTSALLKTRAQAIQDGKEQALSGEGTHPAIGQRIQAIGMPSGEFIETRYDQRISLVNSFNARVHFFNKKFEASSLLIHRNIAANVAVEEDYVILAKIIMKMYDTPEKNQEALDFLMLANDLNVFPTIELYKQEALALIRLGRREEARQSLEAYRDVILNLMSDGGNSYSYYFGEYEWASKMIHKVALL